jgi:hypothetical protein
MEGEDVIREVLFFGKEPQWIGTGLEVASSIQLALGRPQPQLMPTYATNDQRRRELDVVLNRHYWLRSFPKTTTATFFHHLESLLELRDSGLPFLHQRSAQFFFSSWK